VQLKARAEDGAASHTAALRGLFALGSVEEVEAG
jgi:hypothetical protein